LSPLENILSRIAERNQPLRPVAVPPSGTASQKNYPFFLKKVGARKIKKCKGNFSARLSVREGWVAGLRRFCNSRKSQKNALERVVFVEAVAENQKKSYTKTTCKHYGKF